MSNNEAKINRRNVEKLLNELMPGYQDEGKLHDAYRKLDAEYDAAVEEFRDTPAMRKLKARVDEAQKAYESDRVDRRMRVRAVRQMYYAKGPTPKVIERLEKLVEEFNR